MGQRGTHARDLEEAIIDEIRKKGAITFKRFMELSLYHPEFGYYMTGRKRIGKGGDYYTSVSLGPFFGKALAVQMEEMARLIGGPVTIVEMGAGSLDLAKDISGELTRMGIKFDYVAVDVRYSKNSSGKISVRSSLDEVGSVAGIFLSNELVDSFPVHIVEMRGGKILEVYVTFKGGRFREVLMEPSTDDILWYFDFLEVKLPEGSRAEVNLNAKEWLESVSQTLTKGFVVTIDYGYPSRELYIEERKFGTLLCYYKNAVDDNPYEMVGEKDMTSHVNFSFLSKYGEKLGLRTVGFTDQARFLMSLGILDNIETMGLDERLKVKSLILPGGMGEIFKVLIQTKGMGKVPSLKGLSLKNDAGIL